MQEKKKLTGNALFTDIVIGMSDGLIVPFALSAGLSGIAASNSIIVMAGGAGIAAGSIAMAWGGYQAGKAEIDHYHYEIKSRTGEINPAPENEKQDVKEFFANIGLSEELQQKATEEIEKDKKQWADFMVKYGPGAEEPPPNRAARAALHIGLSYAIGGLVPVLPYFFADNPVTALKVSAAITILCLFVFGFFKSRVTGMQPWQGALGTALTGTLAAAAAFGAAKLFQ